MLYPHSLLWHYLWVGPDVLLLVLALLICRRQLNKLFPAFLVYIVFEGMQGLTLYVLDLAPGVSAELYWRAGVAFLVMEAMVKLAVIREIFSSVVGSRPSVARTGKYLIVCTGVLLVALATVAAAHAPAVPKQGVPAWASVVSQFRILEQAIYLVEAGLLLFIYLFVAHHHLILSREQYGIALGLSISACIGLGVFAIYANGILFKGLHLLDFFNMTTYHVCVLLWFYYLLFTPHPSTAPINPETPLENKTNGPIRRAGQRLQPARLLARF
jgi:hypothetical protein